MRQQRKEVVDFANCVACLHNFRNSWVLQKWPGLRYIFSFFSVFGEKNWQLRQTTLLLQIKVSYNFFKSAFMMLFCFWPYSVYLLCCPQVVKQIWAYIRERNLQDPNNRRNIICDDRMRALFNVNSINMFQMNKALSKHIWPLDSDDGMLLQPYLFLL